LLVILWLISQGINDSGALGEIIRSKKAMYLSMPFTLICVACAVYFATRKFDSAHYLVAVVSAIIIGISIHTGSLKIPSIHMNHLPIAVGAFIGALAAVRLNKTIKRGVEVSAPT
jgi:hypothetical protein